MNRKRFPSPPSPKALHPIYLCLWRDLTLLTVLPSLCVNVSEGCSVVSKDSVLSKDGSKDFHASWPLLYPPRIGLHPTASLKLPSQRPFFKCQVPWGNFIFNFTLPAYDIWSCYHSSLLETFSYLRLTGFEYWLCGLSILINLSVPEFLICKNGIVIVPTSSGRWKN